MTSFDLDLHQSTDTNQSTLEQTPKPMTSLSVRPLTASAFPFPAHSGAVHRGGTHDSVELNLLITAFRSYSVGFRLGQ